MDTAILLDFLDSLYIVTYKESMKPKKCTYQVSIKYLSTKRIKKLFRRDQFQE